MKKHLSLLIYGSIFAISNATTLTWTAVFEKTISIPNAGKTQQWCDTHTPTVFVTTEKEIKGGGIVSLNGIKVKYNKYTINNTQALSFSTAFATFSGTDDLKKWELPTTIFEQSFSQQDYFTSIWSNQYCRGFMVGYPSNK